MYRTDKTDISLESFDGIITVSYTHLHIKVGQEVTCILPKADRPYTAAVITLSDKGAAGEREDKSGPAIVEMLKSAGYDIKETLLLADEQLLLEKELMRLSDQRQVLSLIHIFLL